MSSEATDPADRDWWIKALQRCINTPPGCFPQADPAACEAAIAEVERLRAAAAVVSQGPPLTKEEVAGLPTGTAIVVTWSGGNGPHRYVVEQAGRSTYAQPPDDPHGPFRWYNPITVGREPFHTQVWLATDGTEARNV